MAIAKAERLMNLALCLLGTRRPLTKRELRSSIEAYIEASSDDSFNRMFERDKDDLRELGLVIETVEGIEGDIGYLARRDSNRLPRSRWTPRRPLPWGSPPRSGSRPGWRAPPAARSRSCARPECRWPGTVPTTTPDSRTARWSPGSPPMRPPSSH
ncbi:hypothetical protein Srufu_063050 [Streptomyces libani subsp. rufus]|nr:hypothetical protein Srufu_063050 [Streptomyces libani subsp. rufus]